MRRILPLIALFLLCPALRPGAAAVEESTRTLRLELASDSATRFRVENLVGAMRVVPGTGSKVVAVATVRAESDKLAGMIRFEQVRGPEGEPTLRVRYPLDRYDTIRYPSARQVSGVAKFFGETSTSTRYDDHRVKVSSREGVLLYADLEVQMPAGDLTATFRNEVGRVVAQGIGGKLKFDTSSGDVVLERLRGQIQADTGSGNVRATDLEGSFNGDTGSGNLTLAGFRGDQVDCDVGSGNVTVSSSSARRLDVDTGSGDVRVTDSDLEEFNADTGSGDVLLEARGHRLVRVNADTGSGDVTLRLAPNASFEARADQGSGDLTVGYSDAEPIRRNRDVVGYRRGDARIRIDVATGSGDLTIEPGP